ARAIDRDRPGREREVQDRVAVENPRMTEIDVGRSIRTGAGGNDKILGGDAFESPLRLRSEEHTSELQSLRHLVCRVLLEKKKQSSIVGDSPLVYAVSAFALFLASTLTREFKGWRDVIVK